MLRTARRGAAEGLKGLRETLGPLKLSFIEISPHPSSTVPLMADAARETSMKPCRRSTLPTVQMAFSPATIPPTRQ